MAASLFYRDLFGQIGVSNDPYFANTFRPRFESDEEGHASGFEIALLAAGHTAPRATDDPEVRASSGAGRGAPRGPAWTFGEVSLRYTYMDARGSFSDE